MNRPATDPEAVRRAHVLHLRVPPGTPEPSYRAVLALLEDITPVVQAIPPGAALADVSGALRLHRRTPYDLAAIIRLRAQAHLGLDVRLGVAPNWALAATASARTPRTGIRLVPDDPAAVAAFLHPLPIDALHGIGPRQAETLRTYGVHTIGALARIPAATAQRLLGGRAGRVLKERAGGTDPRRPARTTLPRSTTEARRFAYDELEGPRLRTAILDAVVTVGARLRARHQAATGLQLQLTLADGSLLTRSRKLPAPTARTADLRACAYQIADSWALQRARIRTVTVRAEHLIDADHVAEQISLDRTEENVRHLEQTMDRANGRFGDGAVRPATLARRRTA